MKSIGRIERVYRVLCSAGTTEFRIGKLLSSERVVYCVSAAQARRQAINFAVAHDGVVELWTKEQVYP